MKISALVFAGVAAGALLCLAGGTRTWLQSDYPDFEKGNLAALSLRSDGRVTLAPKSVERFDSSSAYLWALAQDSHGNFYTGGGPGAKLFRITSSGGQKLAEFDALEIHAIAIDGKDNIYVGTSPDGKVYKILSSGKFEQFYDPRQKYIWAMVCDSSGNLYIATGDGGEIHRVSPDGKGSVFFKSDETHIRSLAFDGKGDLIAGTEPGGLIVRIDQQGKGFVLYEMGKREITAVAVAPDGGIYAAGVGAKQGSSPSSIPSLPVPPAPSTGISLTVQASPAHSSEILSSPTPPVSRPIAASGSTDVYCVHPGGYPEKVWSSNQDVVYAIAFDSQKRVLLGAGNKGSVYRIDTNSLYTSLLKVSSNQITALQTARDGSLFAATGNVGKIYRFGAGLESQGALESDLFDAGGFTSWGRLISQGELNGGKLTFETRSGNLDRPGSNWSPWSVPISAPAGGRITSPPARFLQWRATLTGAGDRSPDLDSVEVAYLPRNIAPRIDEIEITPANYKYASPAITVTPPLTSSINLPPIGRRSNTPASIALSGLDTSSSSMTYAKGWLGGRWSASDENSDTLSFNVEIRGVKETTWKLLRDKVRDKHFSFDSTAFPDGEYRLRITASDLPSNTGSEALSTQKESNILVIDNTPPRITGMRRETGNIRWNAADALNVIKRAEYSVDGGDWMIVNPVTKLSDSLTLDYRVDIPALGPGEHTIALRVTDDFDNTSVEKIVIPG